MESDEKEDLLLLAQYLYSLFLKGIDPTDVQKRINKDTKKILDATDDLMPDIEKIYLTERSRLPVEEQRRLILAEYLVLAFESGALPSMQSEETQYNKEELSGLIEKDFSALEGEVLALKFKMPKNNQTKSTFNL